MKFHRKLFVIVLSFLFLVCLLWNLYLYFTPEKTTPWHYLYNAMYGFVYLLGGAVAVIYAYVYGLKSNLGKMLLFFGVGLLSFYVGLLMWVYYNFILQVSIPFPSWADAAFILFYPLMFMGAFYLLKVYQSLVSWGMVRDSVIITIFSFILVFGFFSRPDVSAQLPLIQRIINIIYPMGDVATLVVALIALRIGGGKMHPSLYIFSLGVLLQTSADLLFTYRNANGTYWNGDISDLLYTCSAFFMSLGLFEIINNLQQAANPSAVKQEAASIQTNPAQPLPVTPNPLQQPSSDLQSPQASSSNGQTPVKSL